MTEMKESSSLPLLLAMTGAVVAVVAGGWFFLNQQNREPRFETPDRASELIESLDTASPEVLSGTGLKEETVADTAVEPAASVDVELRKARLAADAEIFVLPAGQSALYYYGRVLRADPRHAVAAAELDAVLTRVANDIFELLENEDFAGAYEIASLVAAQAPEHELVLETQRVLDEHTEELVDEAIGRVQAGDDRRADELLAEVENLPDRNPEYLVAVRESITEIRDVRIAAERDRAQRARLANDEAKAAWVKQTRTAIGQGNLLAPAGASASDLLAEENSWDAERELLTAEFVTALLATAQARIDSDELESAEEMLRAAEALDSEAEELPGLRSALDDAFAVAQSRQVVSTHDLIYVEKAAPRYPRRAVERDISGWVVVYFTVTPDGNTDAIEVGEADPERVFDKAAMEAVEQWVFEPVVYRDRVISQRAAARLVFSIE